MGHRRPLDWYDTYCLPLKLYDALEMPFRNKNFFLFSIQEMKETVLDANCDNDDFHPAITAIILAAQRNNFEVVQVIFASTYTFAN